MVAAFLWKVVLTCVYNKQSKKCLGLIDRIVFAFSYKEKS